MSEHYPRSTVSISAWCKRCAKHTHHRVDDGLKGPCFDCIGKLEDQHAASSQSKPAVEEQMNFFGGAA